MVGDFQKSRCKQPLCLNSYLSETTHRGIPPVLDNLPANDDRDTQPLAEIQGSTIANMQNMDQLPAEKLSEPANAKAQKQTNPGSKGTKKSQRKRQVEQDARERALRLKENLPGISIPATITRNEAKKLKVKYQAQLAKPRSSAKSQDPAAQMAQRRRACQLRKACPGIENVPEQVTKATFKNMMKEYKDKLIPSQTDSSAMPKKRKERSRKKAAAQSLPIRPPHPADKLSNRMAPISNERRAEVARNLGGTPNDPIDGV